MLPELEALLTLQSHDVRLMEARRKLEELPGRRTALAGAVAASRESLDVAKKGLETLRLARRTLEKEVEGIQAETVRLERQLYDVKTNHEYQAMLHQIEALKGKRSDGETRILESFDREEQGQRGVAEAERRVKEAEARQKDGEAALAREQADLTQTIHSITQDRESVTPSIPKPLLSRYDRVAKQRDGIGVTEIRKHACGACFRTLTPQALQDAKRSDTVLTCESCGRILVWTEASED
jgi:predicted  nucleic acid-binding Zn-ribbon protein